MPAKFHCMLVNNVAMYCLSHKEKQMKAVKERKEKAERAAKLAEAEAAEERCLNIAHSLQSCVLKSNCLIIACTPIAVMGKVSRLVLGNLVTRASLNPAVPLPGSGLTAPHKARHAHCCVFSPSQWFLQDADIFWMQLGSYKTFCLS